MTLSRRQSGDSAGVTHEVRGSVSVRRGEAALTGLSGNLRDTEMCDPVPGEEELMGSNIYEEETADVMVDCWN